MKKWEKEILEKQIKDESQVTIKLEVVYNKALSEIEDKILRLKSKEQTQSVIYQLKYQEALKSEISAVYDKLSSAWYTTINDYLKDCYEDSFYSTMYGLHQEGIPLVIPFNQKEVAQATAQNPLYLDKVLSDNLYSDTYAVAQKTIGQISKGIAMNESYATIAANISKTASVSLNNALRITRTEAHRITNEVKQKTIAQASDKGADVVKQWDSTIDRRTRKTHIELDGQLRELDQPFKIPSTGATAMYPGGFGIAKEDIHCRCALLQRARWALDKSEVEKMVGDLDGVSEEQLEEWAKKFGVTKDELIQKSNGIIEPDSSINHRIKAQSYNEFKKKYQKKEKIEAAKQAAQADVQKITQLQNAVDDAQQKFDAIPNKTYSGIWKDDVSLDDYEFKKDAISKKKDWYLQQIASGTLTDSQKNLYLKYIDDLDEFEIEGSKYLTAKTELLDLKKQMKAATGTKNTGSFPAEAFTDERKAKAKKYSSKSAADKYHRKYLDSKWDELSDEEKYSVWEYTQNSNPMNKSLSGYHNSWDRSSFKGLGNTKWGYEDQWRYLDSNFYQFGKDGHATYKRAITDLTKAIDDMEFPDDVFLVRGSDNGGFAGMLESIMPLDDARKYLERGDINSLKALVEGNTVKNHAFTSTGIATGTGFSGQVKYTIYAPKGTHGLYAEPASYYGNTVGSNAKLYKTGQAYSSVGNEAEIILQRGTSYRITEINYDGYTYDVHMEVVEQPDYFKYGDEETFNNGATRHKD